MFPYKIDEEIASETVLPPIRIYLSKWLPPDFFAISDWNNPQASAEPEWLSMYVVAGKYFVHPSLLEKMIRENDEKFKNKYQF